MKKVERFFKNKIVWVADASCNAGDALSFQLSQMGAKLILSGGNREALIRTQKTCKGETEILPLTLLDYQNKSGITSSALEAFGEIDILINNSGLDSHALLYEDSSLTSGNIKVVECKHLMNPDLLKSDLNKDGNTSSAKRISQRMEVWVTAMQILRSAVPEREYDRMDEPFIQRISLEIKRLFPTLFSTLPGRTKASA